jgi:glycosyltransferase involved in cell wall biosynthesis
MHMKLTPSISIVTPSFNQAMFIEEAMESVRLQNYSKVEHLIIDGHSTDRTVKLLSDMKSGDKGRRVKWVSERDGGQSEALNKGFRWAN